MLAGEATAPAVYDGWEMDEQLRHIERVLTAARPARISRAQTPGRSRSGAMRAHAGARLGTCVRRGGLPGSPPKAPLPVAVRPPVLRGTIVLLGTAAFGVGIGLLAWSYALGRPQLAPLGAPVALGGQIILLVGLILQMNRNAAAKLDKVEGQLRELKTTTTLLGTTHGPSAAAFYAHLASGRQPLRSY